jgi:hypothetical protein
LTKVLFARTEPLPSAIHDLKWCSAITATALNSVRPVLHLLSHFGIWRALVMLPEAMKYFGGHMAKIIEFYTPQSFRKVSKWTPPAERGKVLAFPQAVRKSA